MRTTPRCSSSAESDRLTDCNDRRRRAAARVRLPVSTIAMKASESGRLVTLDGDSFSCRESNLLPATFNPGSRGAVSESPSEDLFDHVNRPVGANLPGADGEQAVQEGILRFGSLEARHRAKVRNSSRSVVTDALEGH